MENGASVGAGPSPTKNISRYLKMGRLMNVVPITNYGGISAVRKVTWPTSMPKMLIGVITSSASPEARPRLFKYNISMKKRKPFFAIYPNSSCCLQHLPRWMKNIVPVGFRWFAVGWGLRASPCIHTDTRGLSGRKFAAIQSGLPRNRSATIATPCIVPNQR